jgi:hypothetical protein
LDDAVVVADQHDAAAPLRFAGGERFDRDLRADARRIADRDGEKRRCVRIWRRSLP